MDDLRLPLSTEQFSQVENAHPSSHDVEIKTLATNPYLSVKRTLLPIGGSLSGGGGISIAAGILLAGTGVGIPLLVGGIAALLISGTISGTALWMHFSHDPVVDKIQQLFQIFQTCYPGKFAEHLRKENFQQLVATSTGNGLLEYLPSAQKNKNSEVLRALISFFSTLPPYERMAILGERDQSGNSLFTSILMGCANHSVRMELLNVIENIPDDQLVAFLCREDHQKDPLCLSILKVYSDDQFLAKYVNIIGNMQPEFRMQIFTQCDAELARPFGCTVARFCANYPIMLRAYFATLDDLSDVQLMEILAQKNQNGVTASMYLMRHSKQAEIFNKFFTDILGRLSPDQLIKVLNMQDNDGYTMGMYLMQDRQSSGAINGFLSNTLGKLSPDQLVQILNMQNNDGRTMGIFLAGYNQQAEVFNKFFTDTLGKLSSEQLIKVLNMQDNDGWTMSMFLARYNQHAAIFNKFFTDILGKLSSDQLAKTLNEQNKYGVTMGMLLAYNAHNYDAFVAYRKLLQRMSHADLLRNLRVTTCGNETFKDVLRDRTGHQIRQLFQGIFRDANL
jgi:hypothetical protein